MLTIGCGIGEEPVFRINDLEIPVEVAEIRGSQVKLSIEAPPEVVVLRDELVVDEAE